MHAGRVATRSHLPPSFLRPWETERPLGDLHGRDKTPAGLEITRPTEKISGKLSTDLRCLTENHQSLTGGQ